MDPAAAALQTSGTGKKNYTALSESTGIPVSTLWHRDHGRSSLQERAMLQQYLTPQEEKALVKYLLGMSHKGYPLPIKFSRTLAHVIALRRSSVFQTLSDDSVIKPPGKNWAQAFHRRHPELKASRSKPIHWERHDHNIYDKIVDWFSIIGKELSRPDILPENTYNMDETGVLLSILNSIKVLVGKAELQTHRGTGVKRTLITAIECVSADGRHLPPLIIWPAATHRSSWTTHHTPEWHFGHSASGYSDSSISLCWMKQAFDPLTKARANGKPRLLINDGFGPHESLELLKFCYENNIVLCRLPSHTSHKLQPCDVGVFGPLKAAYREEVERLYRGGSDTIGKQHFTLLYDRARRKAMTQRNILSGWSKTGLRPFNPRRVLDDIQKPPENTVCSPPSTNDSTSNDTVMKVPETPITSDALSALRKHVEHSIETAETLDPAVKLYIQKLGNAAERGFAERSILLDENDQLFQQNNEKTTRASRKSTIVGKGKVMKYEDIVKAQEVREAKKIEETTTSGRRRVKGKQMGSPMAPRCNEKEEAVRQIQALGLEQYCSVIEF